MLLHYLLKLRSRGLAVYNNKFVLDSACVRSENHRGHKSLKSCYLFNISRICFKIVRRQTEMMHQQ